MHEPLDQQIKTQARRYLRGEISLRDFHRWFMPASWNVRRHGSPDAERLVGEIGLSLAEFSAGHATEEEIREEFRDLLGNDASTLVPALQFSIEAASNLFDLHLGERAPRVVGSREYVTLRAAHALTNAAFSELQADRHVGVDTRWAGDLGRFAMPHRILGLSSNVRRYRTRPLTTAPHHPS
jgi:hypothetical protein